jgi:hypothetical protein
MQWPYCHNLSSANLYSIISTTGPTTRSPRKPRLAPSRDKAETHPPDECAGWQPRQRRASGKLNCSDATARSGDARLHGLICSRRRECSNPADPSKALSFRMIAGAARLN